MAADAIARVENEMRVLRNAGFDIRPPATVLDFGCGNGESVAALAMLGYDAYGTDFASELGDGDRLRQIQTPYRLPFDDEAADLIVSSTVLEHVQDYDQAFREMHRVLRPNGVSLHLFPPPFRFREPHIMVPLATRVQRRGWLRVWAEMGVRNQFQNGKTAREVTDLNHRFLRDHTTYYSRRHVLRVARRIFPAARFAEQEFLASRQSVRAQRLSRLARRVPIIAIAHGEMRERALLLRKD